MSVFLGGVSVFSLWFECSWAYGCHVFPADESFFSGRGSTAAMWDPPPKTVVTLSLSLSMQKKGKRTAFAMGRLILLLVSLDR